MKPIQSLNLNEIIEKTTAKKSSVSGLFIGAVDKNVLSFPTVVCDKEEMDHLRNQQDMIKQNFLSLIDKPDELKAFGFYDLHKLTATEVLTIFEGIGLSSDFSSPQNPGHSIMYNTKIMDLINKNWQHAEDPNAKAVSQLAVACYLMGRLKSHYEYCIETVDAACKLTPVIGRDQYHFYEMMRDLYKLESMCFYTAGMIDAFEGRDLLPDGIVVKTTATEVAFRIMGHSSHLLGRGWTFGREHDILSSIDEFLGSSFMSKVILGMQGLQEYGKAYATEIEKYRQNPNEAKKKKKPGKLGIDIYFNENFGELILPLVEQMCARLQLETQISYRKNIANKESTAVYLAEQAISIVQAFAVLTRATRQIGYHIENFDADLILAEHEVEMLAIKHKTGSYMTRKELMNETMMELGGYYAPSPFLFFKTKKPKQLVGSLANPQNVKQLN